MESQYLCEKCESLSLRELSQGFYHSLTSDLFHQQPDGNLCSLCALIRWSLRYDERYLRDYPNMGVYLFSNPPPKPGAGMSIWVDVIATSRSISTLAWAPRDSGQPWCLGPPDSKSDIRKGRLTIYGQKGLPRVQPLFAHSKSNECFELARKWLDDCRENHGNSCQSATDYIPTRLVDLGLPGTSLRPSLIDFTSHSHPDFLRDCDFRYAALSYCWGESKFLTATTSDIQDLVASIPWELVPKTIQDAMTATKRMGIQYLWVDALCILHGSDEAAQADWQKESARMDQIFGGAYLTLSANHAAHANEGLFHERNLAPVQSCRLGSTSEHPTQIMLGPEPPEVLPHLEPINKRAWPLLERLSSNRVLSYGTTGLRWMCSKALHHETKPRLRNPNLCAGETIQKEYHELGPQKTHKGYQHWMRVEWTNIIEQYTSRNLAFPSDKLPALFSLAQKIQYSSSSASEKYLAGLWQNDLSAHLLWTHRGQQTLTGTLYTRQTGYRAPSWSWASVDGRVEFLHTYSPLPDTKFACSLNLSKSCTPKVMKVRPLFVLGLTRILPSIRVEHSARYHGGAERVTAWISYPNTLRTYLDDLDVLPRGRVRDVGGEGDRWLKVLVEPLFLYLGSKEVGGMVLFAGIILVKVGKAGMVYRRVGAFEGLAAGQNGKRLRKGDRKRGLSIL